MDDKRLDADFYRRDPMVVAQALLGCRLVRVIDGQSLIGRIVETEAYLGIADKAAHTCGGRRTARNQSMWEAGGLAYVYFTYGMHHCLNVVTQQPEEPTAVLIRAMEPIAGVERMRDHRSGKIARDRLRATDLGSGPAKLCQALAIDRELDGEDLTTSDQLWIEADDLPGKRISRGPRIGVGYAEEWALKPLRYWIRDHRHVSR